eukprot:431203-Hanusia_phi.AAC.3
MQEYVGWGTGAVFILTSDGGPFQGGGVAATTPTFELHQECKGGVKAAGDDSHCGCMRLQCIAERREGRMLKRAKRSTKGRRGRRSA